MWSASYLSSFPPHGNPGQKNLWDVSPIAWLHTQNIQGSFTGSPGRTERRVSACHYIPQNSDIHSGLYNTKLNLFCMRLFVSLKNMYIVHFSNGLLRKQWPQLNENFQMDWIEHIKIHPWQKYMQKKIFRDMFSVKQIIINEMVLFQSF